MSISERIKVLSETEGKLSKFAEKVGLNYQSIHSALRNDRIVRSDTIEAIAKSYPRLNLKWLILGEGEMWLEEEKPSNGEAKELKMQVLELLEGRVKMLEREIKRSNPELAKELGIE